MCIKKFMSSFQDVLSAKQEAQMLASPGGHNFTQLINSSDS